MFINDLGVLELKYTGKIDVAEQEKVTEEAGVMTENLRSQGKKVLLLLDANEMELPSAEVRRKGAELMKVQGYDKIAIFTSNRMLRYINNFISRASGVADKNKMFPDKESALKWLLE